MKTRGMSLLILSALSGLFFLRSTVAAAFADAQNFETHYSGFSSTAAHLEAIAQQGPDVIVLGEYHYQIALLELTDHLVDLVDRFPEYNCLYVEQDQEWVERLRAAARSVSPSHRTLPVTLQLSFYAYLIARLEPVMQIFGVDTQREVTSQGYDYDTYLRRNQVMAQEIAAHRAAGCKKGLLLTGRD